MGGKGGAPEGIRGTHQCNKSSTWIRCAVIGEHRSDEKTNQTEGKTPKNRKSENTKLKNIKGKRAFP